VYESDYTDWLWICVDFGDFQHFMGFGMHWYVTRRAYYPSHWIGITLRIIGICISLLFLLVVESTFSHSTQKKNYRKKNPALPHFPRPATDHKMSVSSHLYTLYQSEPDAQTLHDLYTLLPQIDDTTMIPFLHVALKHIKAPIDTMELTRLLARVIPQIRSDQYTSEEDTERSYQLKLQNTKKTC